MQSTTWNASQRRKVSAEAIVNSRSSYPTLKADISLNDSRRLVAKLLTFVYLLWCYKIAMDAINQEEATKLTCITPQSHLLSSSRQLVCPTRQLWLWRSSSPPGPWSPTFKNARFFEWKRMRTCFSMGASTISIPPPSSSKPIAPVPDGEACAVAILCTIRAALCISVQMWH